METKQASNDMNGILELASALSPCVLWIEDEPDLIEYPLEPTEIDVMETA